MEKSTWVAGADGCKTGWMVVLRAPSTGAIRGRVVPSVKALFLLHETPQIIGIDMVIGLPDTAERGGRACDQAARKLLGWPRSSSVFSPPARAALQAETYDEALRLNRAHSPSGVGLTKQAFYLFPKLRAVAEHVTPARQERVREVHPELAFFAMNTDAPLEDSKHTAGGRAARKELLAAHGFDAVDALIEEHVGAGVTAPDVLDACAACWTAGRIESSTARCVPSNPPRNARGLRMEIWR